MDPTVNGVVGESSSEGGGRVAGDVAAARPAPADVGGAASGGRAVTPPDHSGDDRRSLTPKRKTRSTELSQREVEVMNDRLLHQT